MVPCSWEGGGRSHMTRDAGGLWKLERVQEPTLPWSPPKNKLCRHLDFDPVKPILDSDYRAVRH